MDAENPKYPHITVTLTGNDGNAFGILGVVRRALRQNRVPDIEIEAFYEEATKDDYDHLLQTVLKTVKVL
jgi:hypothetical protein